MDTLNDTEWDILISGTGLPQSLLALSLSRSGKKVLHVDRNDYYGGSEAAFSLDEAEAWVRKNNQGPGQMPFEDVSICPTAPSTDENTGKLSPSRAYTLSLAPQLIYNRSQLVPSLVSSKVYKQLDFLAVGSWWICGAAEGGDTSLQRVPGGREDVFADDSINGKSKRLLMKFLRYLTQPSEDNATGDKHSDLPFSEFLSSKFQIPAELRDPLVSLSLSPDSPRETTARYALPRIKRHLGSIGVFGEGFGSLVTKWGGAAEISQVGCRASAVGGGVYVLNRGVESIELKQDDTLQIQLSDGESVRAKVIVGSPWDLPEDFRRQAESVQKVARSISVVSSPLEQLFVKTSEGGPVPAGVVVNLPAGTLSPDTPPVYLMIHSSDTGECPVGQCVIYGSTTLPGDEGQGLLKSAVDQLISAVEYEKDRKPTVLWSLGFTQLGVYGDKLSEVVSYLDGRVSCFPPPSLDLTFDDGLLDAVRSVWAKVMGGQVSDEEFMKFEDRNEEIDDDDDDDDM